jgi:hypothetical protein
LFGHKSANGAGEHVCASVLPEAAVSVHLYAGTGRIDGMAE